MELTFWANVAFGVIVLVCGTMSSINLYFAIPATLAGIILLWGNIKTHRTEKADFRKKIIQEALAIVDHIIWSTSASHISCANWTTKAEGFKADLLGDRDYGLWKQFYDSVGRRNEYLESRGNFGLWANFAKLNRTIFDNFFKVYDETSWVKESVPEERITDFLSRAQKSACL
jgi:hypothetical protein